VKSGRHSALPSQIGNRNIQTFSHMKIGFLHHSRRRRLFYCVVSLVLALGMARRAQAGSTTTVQDVVYRADGTPDTGTLVISWPAFTTVDNLAVAAGSMSVAIGPQGAISVRSVLEGKDSQRQRLRTADCQLGSSDPRFSVLIRGGDVHPISSSHCSSFFLTTDKNWSATAPSTTRWS